MKWLYFVTSETNIFEQDAMQGVKKTSFKMSFESCSLLHRTWTRKRL